MAISRRTVVAGAAAAAVAPRLARAGGADDGVGTPAPAKVLRYAFEVAETSLDPVKVSDLYSRTLTPHIFEALYTYDHLARPVKIKPLTADGMPQHSDDYRVWTVRVRPGIYFASDPAFKGQRRELVAQDYVYAIKRFADPANKSPAWSSLENEGLVGLNELRQRGIDEKKPFAYDQRGRRVARARPLHDPLRGEGTAPALPPDACSERSAGRGSARGGRLLRRPDRGPSGRHRPVQADSVAAQLVHRFRAQPRLSRDVLRRRACCRRRRRPGAGSALQGPPVADGRSGRDLDHRGGAAALALVRQRRGRRRLPGRLPVRAAGDAQRQDRAQPRQARHPRLSGDRGRRQQFLLQHGRCRPSAATARRRWRCGARSASASTRARSSPTPTTASACRRRGRPCLIPAPSIRSRRPSSATTTRRAPGRCSICTASPTRTVTAGASGPMARRWCSACRPSRSCAIARSPRC